MISVPLQVYLDSSDYSNLSKVNGLSSEYLAIRDKLLEFSDKRLVSFRYSGLHISEMSPLKWEYSEASILRADMLKRLGGNDALISMDKLILFEIKSLIEDEVEISVFQNNGDWLPSIDGNLFKKEDIISFDKVEPYLAGLSREMRRKLKSSKSFKKNFVEELKSGLEVKAEDTVAEIVAKYPMTPENADIIRKYFIGKATQLDANNAFNQSLRDPSWLMRWFQINFEKMNFIVEWLRAPAEKNNKVLLDAIGAIENLRSHDMYAEALSERTSKAGREKISDSIFLKTCEEIFESLNLVMNDVDVIKRKSKAKGLHACTSIAAEVMLNSFNVNPRVPKASDFVDALNAIYAPYVDIFRTDSFMAPIVSRHMEKHGTKVVGKITSLVPEIEKMLALRVFG